MNERALNKIYKSKRVKKTICVIRGSRDERVVRELQTEERKMKQKIK